ncbi:MAG: VCBS repeat-containing protein [Candidatus Hydrogenedentota bacterium]
MLTICALTIAFVSSADLQFEKRRIADTPYEACSVFDVDKDGALDIVSGEYWFSGPTFAERHKICDVMPSGDYFDDFADYPMDVNRDGYLDIVTGAWFGMKISWRENPGAKGGEWKVFDVAQVGNVERPCFWDVDGDGAIDVVPNTPNDPQSVLRLKSDGSFVSSIVGREKSGHGLGFGDINGDGRGDLVYFDGWLEAPENRFGSTWTWHADFNVFPQASVPIIVHDVNADGRNDLIVGNGHGYGLAWWEQADSSWTKHDIETDKSQFHDAMLVDLDKDGAPELVTGKRWRAHPEGDPGVDDPVGLYYYEINGGAFERHILDFGDPASHSGTGIYLWVADVDGNSWPDICAPGKEGLDLFLNQGSK